MLLFLLALFPILAPATSRPRRDGKRWVRVTAPAREEPEVLGPIISSTFHAHCAKHFERTADAPTFTNRNAYRYITPAGQQGLESMQNSIRAAGNHHWVQQPYAEDERAPWWRKYCSGIDLWEFNQMAGQWVTKISPQEQAWMDAESKAIDPSKMFICAKYRGGSHAELEIGHIGPFGVPRTRCLNMLIGCASSAEGKYIGDAGEVDCPAVVHGQTRACETVKQCAQCDCAMGGGSADTPPNNLAMGWGMGVRVGAEQFEEGPPQAAAEQLNHGDWRVLAVGGILLMAGFSAGSWFNSKRAAVADKYVSLTTEFHQET